MRSVIDMAPDPDQTPLDIWRNQFIKETLYRTYHNIQLEIFDANLNTILSFLKDVSGDLEIDWDDKKDRELVKVMFYDLYQGIQNPQVFLESEECVYDGLKKLCEAMEKEDPKDPDFLEVMLERIDNLGITESKSIDLLGDTYEKVKVI